ncbi:calmodulin-like protein 5 [Quercus suber]|uniref:Calmodulin-like protein 5 n=1 Tax=Quercus suber TaxID=58331 RepID=A0AAW0M3U7_QUESU
MGRIVDNKPIKPMKLTEDQIKKIFKKYDVNNDNQLSKEELKKAFHYLGSIIPGIRANRGLHHADANKDGVVDEGEMNELVKYAVGLGFKPLPPTEDQLRNIFKKYDTNNDNKLSREELKKAFDYLGSLIPGFRADRGLHHADANKDGYVNEREMDELVKYAVRVGFTVKA